MEYLCLSNLFDYNSNGQIVYSKMYIYIYIYDRLKITAN